MPLTSVRVGQQPVSQNSKQAEESEDKAASVLYEENRETGLRKEDTQEKRKERPTDAQETK